MPMKDVFILSATRTAIGRFGGSLSHATPIDLGIAVAQTAIARAGLDPATIAHGVFGHVIPTEARDMYIARCITMGAGMPASAPALQVNRLCGSGLQAVVSAAQLIALGDASAVLAGGTEVMSKGGHMLPSTRSAPARLGDISAIDMTLGALSDPFGGGPMGVTAENVAKEYHISREDMDALALRSQQRAAHAITSGYFEEQITPITLPEKHDAKTFARDEYPRPQTSLEKLATLPPAFQEGGSVTAGNSAGINDGAAAVLLADAEMVKRSGRAPLARIISYGFGGVPSRIMGMGPVPAVKMALSRAGMHVGDLDCIESNEAFAAQTCAVSAALGFDEECVNVHGGAIALGHPIGATGAIILTKLIYELRRRNGRYGLATMCIGGGQGIALLVEAN